MDRYFLVSLFCTLLFLAAGCQKAERGSTDTENLSGAEIVIPARWFKVAGFRVENVAARNSEVHAGTVGLRAKGSDAIECRLLQDPPDKTDKWFPIALKFLSPNQPGKKLSAAFADTLSFSKPSQSERLLNFLVDFKKDAFEFASFWKVEPYLAETGGEKICAARAELCMEYEEQDGKLACKGKWHWLKEIVAVPDVVAYFTGKGERLTGIKGVYYSQKDGKIVEDEPVTIK